MHLKLAFGNSYIAQLLDVGEDGMFRPVLGQGLEYQIGAVKNTVTTDTEGRKGGDFSRNIITILSMHCVIRKA